MRILTGFCFILFLTGCAAHESVNGYHLTNTVPLPSAGGWDFVKVDDEARRVYIAHSTQVEVIDADSGKPIGVISNIKGAHGITIAFDTSHGFITNGKSDTVTVFDVKTLNVTGQIKAGKKPDAIAYDRHTHRIFVFNADGNSATVIDAKKLKSIGTIALGGAPEFAVPDKAGHIYVNLEDKSEMLQIDASTLKVMNRWSLAPCTEPSSLAIDRKNHRLFAGCSNHILTVVDATNGSIVSTLPIGEKVDATAFDPETYLIISSNGDGTMTVIHEDDADHYHIIQTVVTPKRSKTFGLDKKTHKLFVPSAMFGPTQAPSKDNPKGRPQILPGTFSVLIFEQ
jgi:YVTN family beta-propeller protein